MMTVAIIIALYVLSIAHLASRWNMIRQAFVVDGSTADAILTSLETPSTWLVVVSTLSLSLMTLIADCVMIWRCWMVWERDWRVVVVPLLVTIVGTVFCALSVMSQIQPQDPYMPSNRTKFTNSGIVYFSLSLVSSVISTTLIIYRIIAVSRGARIAHTYRGIIEIISESAALYAIVLIVFLPMFVMKNFTQGYAQAILVPITGIAPTLVTARVSLGLSKEYNTSKMATPTLTNWDSSMPHGTPVQISLGSLDSSPSETTANTKDSAVYPPKITDAELEQTRTTYSCIFIPPISSALKAEAKNFAGPRPEELSKFWMVGGFGPDVKQY
ncbi:hypothetical protein NP233_g8453 [Leucocoprinus birnbaumii]|uniref:Uncharacterized protein n=1 Tax=Leucocoprinus birnbaumii TaxID=56174 RepID=A0AAD5YN53_9AGAR|nr:hypothetical protein NP233_g8453 [Leucocoprinus birnbaumii]